MLSVLIECQNHEAELAHTLSSLVAGAVEGLVSDVTVLDSTANQATAQIAEAAGCRYFQSWALRDVISSARGEWILVLEPGSRPLTGWVEVVSEYMVTQAKPARFSVSRGHRRNLFQRLFTRPGQIEVGLLMPKRTAEEKAEAGGPSTDVLAYRQSARRLSCEIVPAWAMPHLN